MRPSARHTPLLVVAALPIELAGRQRGLPAEPTPGGGRVWAQAGAPLAFGVTGVGRRAVEASLPAMIERLRPARLVLLGTAGGCEARLRCGDLVLAERVLLDLDPAPAPPLAPDPDLSRQLEAAARAANTPVHTGPLVTTSTVALPRAKASLRRNLGAIACDMEAFWIGTICRERGLAFACARAVFDTVEETLPQIDPDRVARSLLRRPRLGLSLPGLALRMRRCRRALAALIDRLAARPVTPG